MKKIILATIIFIAVVFSFEKSFGKHCNATFYVGGTINFAYFYTLSISADTLFNIGDVINLPVTAAAGSGPSCNCTSDSVWWIHNGALISNSLSYTVTDTGYYIIHLNVDGGLTCSGIWNFEFTLHVGYRTATSVNEISNPNILQIYPNPTNSTFTIKNISSSETSLLQIINFIGEVVYTEKFFGRKEYEVTANFAKGIYFVRVGNVVRKLVIE